MSHSVESAREEQPPRSSTESIEVSYVQSNRQARLISSSKTPPVYRLPNPSAQLHAAVP